jgi:hypothetical protein
VQNAAPFGVTIERFGSARVIGPNRFDVTAVRVGATTINTPAAVTRPFGRGQFFDLTDEQRLTQPSFEPFDAGVTVASSDFTFGPPVGADINFETAYLEMEPDAPRGTLIRATLIASTLPFSALDWQPRSGGVARSLVREKARAPLGASLGVSVEPVPLVAVNVDSLGALTDLVLTGQAAFSPTIAGEAVASAIGRVAVVESFDG